MVTADSVTSCVNYIGSNGVTNLYRALGYGADVDVNKIGVSFRSAKGTVKVCENGAGVPFSEEIAKEILLEKEIEILLTLGNGPYGATAWGCDLTYDYVKINGDYRT